MRLSECSIPWFYSTLENNSDNNNNKQPFTGLFLKQVGSRLGRGKGSSPTPPLLLPKSRDAGDSTISCLIRCPCPSLRDSKHEWATVWQPIWDTQIIFLALPHISCVLLTKSFSLSSDAKYEEGFGCSQQIQ